MTPGKSMMQVYMHDFRLGLARKLVSERRNLSLNARQQYDSVSVSFFTYNLKWNLKSTLNLSLSLFDMLSLFFFKFRTFWGKFTEDGRSEFKHMCPQTI